MLERGRGGTLGTVLVGLAFAVTMVGTTLPTPLYPAYASTLGFGELVTTLVYATYAVGVIGALVLIGHWSDQLGRRPMVLVALAFSALSAAAFLMPLALPWLFVGRLLSGISAGVVTGTATAYVVDLARPSGRARASLVAAAVNMAGLGCGPLLAGLLTEHAPGPLRLCFLVDLALIGTGLVAVLLARETVPRADRPRLAPQRLTVPPQARAVFVRAAIAGFAGFAVLGLMTSLSPAILGQLLDQHSPSVVGGVVALVFAASIAGQALASSLPVGTALPTGCVLLVAGMAVLMISLATRSFAVLLVAGVVAGAGQGISFRAGLGDVQAAAPPELRGTVTSTFFTTLYVGISLPVIGEGALAASAGLETAGIVFASVVALLGLVALGLLVRSRSTATG
jgi:predicted MFS family arabinose efflux permease